MATLEAIRKAVGRLEKTHTLPRAKTTDQVANGWNWALNEAEGAVCPTDPELLEAVGRYAAGDNTHWPAPGRIGALVVEQRQRTAAVQQRTEHGEAHDDKPCPACGATLRLLGADEQVNLEWSEAEGAYVDPYRNTPRSDVSRYGVLHDLRKHREYNRGRSREQQIPCVGYWR